MRILEQAQGWLFRPFLGRHPHARELEAISQVLDEKPEIARLAQADLTAGARSDTGRKGMNGDQAIRILLLKQIHGLSYRALAFHLQDSTAFRGFARVPSRKPWEWTTLQTNLKRLQPRTLERINRLLVRHAKEKGIEDGRKIRTDCTAVETNIHAPSDSNLLWDCVRVITRLLHRIQEALPGTEVHFSDHTKRARRRAHAIAFPARGKKRDRDLRKKYRDLLRVSRKTCGYGHTTLEKLQALVVHNVPESILVEALTAELRGYLDAMERVLTQTTRRVLQGEKVSADEKLLSIFEKHTDIIIKGERDVVFGHKICLTGGASSLILDCVIEDGNPADSSLVRRTLERQIDLYGKPPVQVAFDGGFTSKANLQIAKEELGVQQVAFHKKCALEISDMVSSAWLFRRLRRFRAGIEGVISTLKRAFRMNRCTWRSLPSFHSYVWSCVLGFNAIVIARHLLQ